VQAAREGDAERFTDDPATRLFLPLATKITRHAYKVVDEDVEVLREAGWDDELILEAVHIACVFNFIDRLADTFGIGIDELVEDGARMAEAHARAADAR
jgi:alkylhydroperoxidase family enzyme